MSKKLILSSIAIIWSIAGANAACDTAVDCHSCMTDLEGCVFCEYTLNYAGGGILDNYRSTAGICVDNIIGCPILPTGLEGLKDGLDPRGLAVAIYAEVLDVVGCPATTGMNLGVIPILANECGLCPANFSYCAMVSYDQPRGWYPAVSGGTCIRSSQAAFCNDLHYKDVQIYNGAMYQTHAKIITDCCEMTFSCVDCVATAGCTWCALNFNIGLVGNSSGFGRCVAGANCGAVPKSIADIFKDVATGIDDVYATVDPTLLLDCQDDISPPFWYSHSAESQCFGSQQLIWCSLTGVIADTIDTLNFGGMCLSMYQADICSATSTWSVNIGLDRIDFLGTTKFIKGSAKNVVAGSAAVIAAAVTSLLVA